MDTWVTTLTGVAIVIVAAGAVTAVACTRGRRGAGRLVVALLWVGLGVVGATVLGMSLAPTQRWILVFGTTLTGVCLVCAAVLAFVRRREMVAARRRDAALGQPPIFAAPSMTVIVCATGVVAVFAAGSLIAPWMLVAAYAADVAPGSIIHGLISNVAVAAPILWAVLVLVMWRHRVRVARDATTLRRGVELRVADAEAVRHRPDRVEQLREVRYRTGDK